MANAVYSTAPSGAKTTNPGGWTPITVQPAGYWKTVWDQGNYGRNVWYQPPAQTMYVPPTQAPQQISGSGGAMTYAPTSAKDQWGNVIDTSTLKPVYWGPENALVGYEFMNPLTGETNFMQTNMGAISNSGEFQEFMRQTNPTGSAVTKQTDFGPIHQQIMLPGDQQGVVWKNSPLTDPTFGTLTKDTNEISPFVDEANRTLAALAAVAAGGALAGTAAFGAPTGLPYTATLNPGFAAGAGATGAGEAAAAGGLGALSESVTGPALAPIDAAGAGGGALEAAGAGGGAWETALGGGVGGEFGGTGAITGLGGAETGGLGVLTGGELGTVGTAAGGAAGGLGGLGQAGGGAGDVVGDIDFGGLGGTGSSGGGTWGQILDQLGGGNVGGALETGGGALWDWIKNNPQAALGVLGGVMQLFSDPAHYDYTGGAGGGGAATGKQLPVLPPMNRQTRAFPGDLTQYGKISQTPGPGAWDWFGTAGGTAPAGALTQAAGGPIRGALEMALPARYFDGGPGGGQDDLLDAKVSPGEFVFDASTVSDLGDGNNEEGARKLKHMVEQIRAHKRGGQRNLPPRAPRSPLEYLKGV